MSDTLILCYHAVSETFADSLAVTPAALADQVSRLLTGGYSPCTFARAVLDPPSSRTLAVTFDDAYRSVGELAHPLLRELGVPATVFAPTSFIGGGAPMSWDGIEHLARGPHAQELVPLDWQQLGELADEGWEIGSHTVSHPHLPRLGEEALQEELARSRREIAQRLGRPCTSIAYPYGDLDDRVVSAAATCGYEAGAALGLVRDAPLRRSRVGVYRRDAAWRFALKRSRTVRRLRTRS